MLKRRLIPKLQLDIKQSYKGIQPVLVITKQFTSKRWVGDPISQAKIYEAQLADELILVNLSRSEESWYVLLETVESMADTLATPLAVGGGIHSLMQVKSLLDRGADKVVINSAAIKNPGLIDAIAESYGSQCVVLSVDVRNTKQGEYRVWTEGGSLDSGKDPFSWTNEAVDRGAGEIIVTSIDRDGSGNGLDLELTRKMVKKLKVPVISSGGCGLAQHFVEGYETGASGIAAGTFFCQRDQNPMQCRSHIHNAGIKIRICS